MTSTSEWTGVKLATLLEAAGLQAEATWLLAEGGDAAGLTRSVPLTGEVLSEAMVCYGQKRGTPSEKTPTIDRCLLLIVFSTHESLKSNHHSIRSGQRGHLRTAESGLLHPLATIGPGEIKPAMRFDQHI